MAQYIPGVYRVAVVAAVPPCSDLATEHGSSDVMLSFHADVQCSVASGDLLDRHDIDEWVRGATILNHALGI